MDRAGGGLGPRHDAASRVQKPESAAEKMAALKARVAAAIGGTKAKGGLGISLHPALEDLGQWKPNRSTDNSTGSSSKGSRSLHDSSKSASKKPQGTLFQNRDPGSNPYIDSDSTNNGPTASDRRTRELVFNPKGKYIAQANALRKQAALDQLKQRIAEQTRKSGIEEYETKHFFEEPPAIEWWDAALVESYDALELQEGSITQFIQHPVQLEPPQDLQNPEPKAMFLTAKEQAKLRRQRRGAALKELQAKIRLGLEPAPPPKVKKKNLMRVLGTQAVENPTAVEQLVEKQIQDRHQKHVEANHERKLTKDQRSEKLATNQEKDAAHGLHIMVFKINSLVNGRNRYKIAVNAEQLALTGVCIMNPEFNLVIVEGGAHSVTKYRKLMLNRINWSENAAPTRDDKQVAQRQWLMAEDDKGSLKDLSANSCTLIFEGEVKNRSFRKWGSRVAETPQDAREVLTRVGMENFWAQAKSTT